MAVGVQKAWSTTAGSNGSADSNVGMAEGQSPPSLNNGVRAAMAAIKGFANQILGAKTTGGSANAQTFTSDSVAAISTAYAAGMGLVFVAGYTNSGATTLNVDGVGATAIRKGGANTALAANDIVAGGVYFVVYNGTYWTLLNPETGQTAAGFQPLDATLTAFAGLTTADDRMLDFTGVDTMAVVSYATVLANLTGNTPTAAGLSVLNFTDPNADQLLFWDDSAGDFVGITSMSSGITISGTTLLADETWIVAVSDETTTITTGTNKATFCFPYNVTVVSVGASVNTVSSSGTPTFDINEGGTTIISTKITIDANEKTSGTAATPPVISDSAIAAFAEVGVDIDVAGTGAKGAKVWMIVRRTS